MDEQYFNNPEWEDDEITTIQADEEDDEMPNFNHGRLQIELIFLLRSLLQLGISAYPPITFQGATRRYLPDVVVYPKRTTPILEETSAIEPTAPILAVEIISPGQTMGEMIQKCRQMLTDGVQECWIIEPANETVTVCRPEQLFALHRGESLQHELFTRLLVVDEIFDV